MRRSTRTRRFLPVVVVIGLLMSLAAPALATPPAVPDFGPRIDGYARYEGQTRCLSTEQPGVREFRALLQRAYGANSGGITRSCSQGGKSEHKEGRAYDWMLNAGNSRDRAKADEFLKWLLATDEHGNKHAMARRFGVMYIIWNKRTWSAYKPDAGWQPYSGASPHTDHIHFSFSWAGAQRKTTYWTAAGSGSATVAAAPGPFKDVPADHPFAKEISWLSDAEITTGNQGRFLPAGTVTRAHMALFLWRLMDEPKVDTPHGFRDVPDDAQYADAVRWLKEAGVTDGVAPDRFGPEQRLTRGQMAGLLWNLVGNPQGSNEHPFTDVPELYEEAVRFLRARTITQGLTATTYGTSAPIRRDQMAAFLYRLTGRQAAWNEADAVPSTVRFD